MPNDERQDPYTTTIAMTRRRTPRPWKPGTVGLLLGFAVLTVAPCGVADASPSCTSLARRASRIGLATALKCLARAKRLGQPDDAACVARGTATVSRRMARGGAACAVDAVSAAEATDRCTARVLSEISDVGLCASRKLRATRASISRGARRAALCRAFERAGVCPGSCAAVDQTLATCELESPVAPPPVADDARVVFFGTYEGDAISTATVAGQDEPTDSARVVVEPGNDPLYVVLSSFEPMIWRFTGDTARISRVVLVGSVPQGVTGVAAADVVDLTSATNPIVSYFYEVDSPEGVAARAAVEQELGRPVDVFAASYSVGTLTLPAATVEASPPSWETPPGFDEWTYVLATFFSPGGVVSIDPADVVSTSTVEAYDVLPQGFGLAQLVATGALQTGEGYYYIAQAIPRFPAGLYGAHSVTFVLGRGVPMPAGSPGHSCVILEETGLPIDDWSCWFSPPVPGECPLPEAPAADRIVLFGTYEGDAMSTVTVAGQDEVTQTARVVIEPGTEPLYLVLASYEAMIWRFEGDTSRIDRVVFTGYRNAGVIGIPAEKVTDLTGVDGCFTYFYDARSPEGVMALGTIERVLGRPADVVAGTYSVGVVTLPAAVVEPTEPPLEVPPGFDPAVYAIASIFTPGGVVAIDASSVVSNPPAQPYEVLPQGFGLSQLVATGALEDRGGWPFATLYIARAIPRFPAGLYGAHSVTFVLGRGVPMPSGDPGHSCVLSEATGLPVMNGFLCSMFWE